MSTESDQNRIDDLFARAVALPAEERDAFLKSTCDGDADVVAKVQKLIAVHERAERATEFLAEPPDELRMFSDNAGRKHPLVGQRIGPYEVKRWLGGGGFGHVYLAFRSDDYRQKVAVKVLRSDIEVDDRILARFELERQLLADLQHEHIARLLYGGTLDTGRPYIVMEYVKGKPITVYCDDKKLSIAERLAIFRQVCEAVAYAHRYSAIHRDIKPGNILVTDDGTVKLLDFGIAKMVDPISQRRMVTISEGGMPLTPEYASPEQVRGEGISTASDVYSLGVVLYELLTGRRPYEFRRYTPAEFERVICEEEPRKPSAIVLEPVRIRREDGTDDVRSAETLAIPRSADSQKLNRLLKGDLEQIILMALRKEPQRRYHTVEALVQDLDRYNSGQSIAARPLGRIERAWRWCKRKPVVAALSGALILLLTAISIVAPIVAFRQAALRHQAVQSVQETQAALVRLDDSLQQRDAAFVGQQKATQLAELRNTALQEQLASNLMVRAYGEYSIGKTRQALVRLLSAYQIGHHNSQIRASACNLMAGWSNRVGRLILHDGPVTVVAFSPDGRTILTASTDGTASLWESQSGKLATPRLEHEGQVYAAAFSPDGNLVATGSDDHTARLWDAHNGNPLSGPLKHGGWVRAIAFNPDGRKLVTACNDKTIQIWDTRTGQPLGKSISQTGVVRAIAFSVDGRRLLSGNQEGTVQLWDAESGQPLKTLIESHDGIYSAIFSPDGKHIAAGNAPGETRLWDADTGKLIGELLPRHTAAACGIAFSPEGQKILTGSWDRTARLWNADSRSPVGEPLVHDGPIWAVAYSPDGRSLLTGSFDCTARLWALQNTRPLLELSHDGPVRQVSFSPDGKLLLSGSSDKTARLWNAQSGNSVGEVMRHPLDVLAVAFSPDGQIAATGCKDQSARLFDARTGRSLSEPLKCDGPVTVVVFSPDSRTLLTAAKAGSAFLWDVSTGKSVGQPIQQGTTTFGAAFSPDGRTVVMGTSEPGAQLWNTVTGKPVGRVLQHQHQVRDVKFTPDGNIVVTGSYDHTARLWDAHTGEPLGKPVRQDGPIVRIAVSSDSRMLLTGGEDGTCRIWDIDTQQPIGEPMQHNNNIVNASFSPNGRSVLTASIEGKARLWDSRTGLPLGEPIRHNQVNFAAFSPDGRTIATAGNDGFMRLWPVPQSLSDNSDVAAWVKARTGLMMVEHNDVKQLSQAEWLKARDDFEQPNGNKELP